MTIDKHPKIHLPLDSDNIQAFIPDSAEIKLGVSKILMIYAELPDLVQTVDPNFVWRGGSEALYSISPEVLEDIAIRIERDKQRFRVFHGCEEPAPEKVGGMFIYWIAKLRPMYYPHRKGHSLTRTDAFLNAYLAIFTGLNRVISSSTPAGNIADILSNRTDIFPNLGKALDDWLYTITYRNFSSDDMVLALKLGIKPLMPMNAAFRIDARQGSL